MKLTNLHLYIKKYLLKITLALLPIIYAIVIIDKLPSKSIDKFFYYITFILEYIFIYATYIALIKCFHKYKLIMLILCSFLILYCSIICAQIYSIFSYGDYIPTIGFLNMNNIMMILSTNNIVRTVAILTVLYISIGIIYFSTLKENMQITTKRTMLVVCSAICYIVVSFSIIQFPPPPMFAFFYNYAKSFIEIPMVQISSHNKVNEPLPAVKDQVYNSDIVFSNNVDKPNIIILVPDGIPARLINGYRKIWDNNMDNEYPIENLTPNIDKLMTQSLVIDNYFNHTAATYPGVTGMYTSSFPYRGISYSEIEKIKNKKRTKPTFSSLFDILHINGYTSFFIDANPEKYLLSYVGKNILNVEHVYNFSNFNTLSSKETTHIFLQAQDIFKGIKQIMENTKEPFVVSAYFLDTHLGVNPVDIGGIGYKDNQNIFLNALHNFDMQLGLFMDWFINSPFADNTILILTTDHTHAVDNEYRQLMNNYHQLSTDFIPVFFDKIPFIILMPDKIKQYYDAQGQSSINFTPTILHLLNYKDYRNAFLGTSIWEKRSKPQIVTISHKKETFCIKDNKLVHISYCQTEPKVAQELEKIHIYRLLEVNNNLFDGIYTK